MEQTFHAAFIAYVLTWGIVVIGYAFKTGFRAVTKSSNANGASPQDRLRAWFKSRFADYSAGANDSTEKMLEFGGYPRIVKPPTHGNLRLVTAPILISTDD